MWILSGALATVLVCGIAQAQDYRDRDPYTTSTERTTTPEPPITWFECPDQYSYHAVSNNCTQYLICVFGKPYLRACEGGLHWNDLLKICDWPNPKTNCMQVDGDTAYRPEVSPAVTMPPMPSDQQGSDRDSSWNPQHESRSQNPGFRPDDDAARDQLSQYAGKKVVYFDPPQNSLERPSQEQMSNEGADGAPSNQLGQGRPADRPQDQAMKPRRPVEQLMPVGQMQGGQRPAGAPQRMSAWDVGNEQDPDQVPSPPRAMAPAQAPAAPKGAAPPWAEALLAKKKGVAPASRPSIGQQPAGQSQDRWGSGANEAPPQMSDNSHGQQPSSQGAPRPGYGLQQRGPIAQAPKSQPTPRPTPPPPQLRRPISMAQEKPVSGPEEDRQRDTMGMPWQSPEADQRSGMEQASPMREQSRPDQQRQSGPAATGGQNGGQFGPQLSRTPWTPVAAPDRNNNGRPAEQFPAPPPADRERENFGSRPASPPPNNAASFPQRDRPQPSQPSQGPAQRPPQAPRPSQASDQFGAQPMQHQQQRENPAPFSPNAITKSSNNPFGESQSPNDFSQGNRRPAMFGMETGQQDSFGGQDSFRGQQNPNNFAPQQFDGQDGSQQHSGFGAGRPSSMTLNSFGSRGRPTNEFSVSQLQDGASDFAQRRPPQVQGGSQQNQQNAPPARLPPPQSGGPSSGEGDFAFRRPTVQMASGPVRAQPQSHDSFPQPDRSAQRPASRPAPVDMASQFNRPQTGDSNGFQQQSRQPQVAAARPGQQVPSDGGEAEPQVQDQVRNLVQRFPGFEDSSQRFGGFGSAPQRAPQPSSGGRFDQQPQQQPQRQQFGGQFGAQSPSFGDAEQRFPFESNDQRELPSQFFPSPNGFSRQPQSQGRAPAPAFSGSFGGFQADDQAASSRHYVFHNDYQMNRFYAGL